mmetsp:Transcript_23680/g.71018  ORF Transcript_23680/g.71018 Transcript_23680/m.71018 type:complete len:173 (+) Transcript_23680:215-733(+)
MARTLLLAALFASAAGFAPRPNVVPRRHAPVMMGAAKNGLFSPLVRVVRRVVGTDRFNKAKSKIIAEHTKVIQAFVETSDSPFGCIALKKLFEIADENSDGTISREELEKALNKLGFYHLKPAQIDQILQRADDNDDCVIDYDEFVKEAPRTLKTNLVKLAKNNGAELGLLS